MAISTDKGYQYKIGDGSSTWSALPYNEIGEYNQNAFSKIMVVDTLIEAETAMSALQIEGNNVTLLPDASNNKIIISVTNQNVIDALGYTPLNAKMVFIGSKAQYDVYNAEGKIPVGAMVVLTDQDINIEDPSEGDATTTAELGKAMLGYMILQ